MTSSAIWRHTLGRWNIVLLSLGYFLGSFASTIISLNIVGSTLRTWLHLMSTRIKFCPQDWKQPYIKMLVWQFSNIIIYVKIIGKIPDQHLNVWLFSNQGDKVQKRKKPTGQICPVLSTRIWTFSLGLEDNHTLKCWSGIFPTILTCMILLKIARTTFQCMVVLQSWRQNWILAEILWSQFLRVERIHQPSNICLIQLGRIPKWHNRQGHNAPLRRFALAFANKEHDTCQYWTRNQSVRKNTITKRISALMKTKTISVLNLGETFIPWAHPWITLSPSTALGFFR